MTAFDWEQLAPGERPDTIVITGLPCEWFGIPADDVSAKFARSASSRLRTAFEQFGRTSNLDVVDEEMDDESSVASTESHTFASVVSEANDEEEPSAVSLLLRDKRGGLPEEGLESIEASVAEGDEEDESVRETVSALLDDLVASVNGSEEGQSAVSLEASAELGEGVSQAPADEAQGVSEAKDAGETSDAGGAAEETEAGVTEQGTQGARRWVSAALSWPLHMSHANLAAGEHSIAAVLLNRAAHA